MVYVRFHGDHHPALEASRVSARGDRFLLVPPASDTVSGKDRLVFDPGIREPLDDKAIHVARRDSGAALIFGGSIDVPDRCVFPTLLVRRLSDDRASRLMARVALSIRDIVGPDGVALMKAKSLSPA